MQLYPLLQYCSKRSSSSLRVVQFEGSSILKLLMTCPQYFFEVAPSALGVASCQLVVSENQDWLAYTHSCYGKGTCRKATVT